MKTLSGTQTAAVVLMNLDHAQAVAVMRHLREEDAEAVTAEIMRLRDLDADTTVKALSEFNRIVKGHLPPARGGRDLATELLNASFGAEKAAGLLTRVTNGMNGSSLDFLNSMEPAAIASIIDGELPGTIALVLAHLPAERAAQVLSEIPESIRTEAMMAMANMGTTNPDAIAIIAEALRSRSGGFAATDTPETLGGVEPLVDIINRSDPALEKSLMANLAARDADLAEDIRSRMFTFVDLVILDDKDMQRIVRGIDIGVLAKALKGAPGEVADIIRRNMTERNRANLEEETELLGQVRVSQVEEARAEIVRTIRELEAAGEIRIERAGEDEYVV